MSVTDPRLVRLDMTRAGVAMVTLNRPDVRNAMNADVIAQLADILETLRVADTIRIVFLEGAGDVFCAGGDMAWMRAAAHYTHSDNEEDALQLARMLKRLRDLPQMTVALVHGAAMGGGVGLVAACDAAVAVEGAQFRFSEVRLGVIPATISPYVVEAIGPRMARALFASARGFDAAYAERIGLVHDVVADRAGLADKAEEYARGAFLAAPGAVTAAKRLVDEVAGAPIDEHLLHRTAKLIADARGTKEGQEGLSAFLEKRKPDWAE